MSSAIDPSVHGFSTALPAGGANNRDAMQEYITRQRELLKNMAKLRLHPKLRTRLDVSDVVQEVMVDAIGSLDGYLENPQLPPKLWLRRILHGRLHNLHRDNLDAGKRDVRREVAFKALAAQSDVLAQAFQSPATPPPDAVIRHENQQLVQAAIESLVEVDQEILALRHFEQLEFKEIALILNITVNAASKRYIRALVHLKAAMAQHAPSENIDLKLERP